MDTNELKQRLMHLLGESIDEDRVPGVSDSFVEMETNVMHVCCDGQDRYFRVTLTETTEDQYFIPYTPEKGS